ncbi:MAG TPA: hypothetical protein VN699_14780 [Pirellulales bacterium]|nr:hypothetical protein [Pirellulales bacterium]
MAGSVDLPLTISALESALSEADPSAVLAPPRILRRVIKQHRQIGGIGLKVPHRKTYAIAAEELLKIVDRDELDIPAQAPLPANVILLARPDAENLASLTSGEALGKYWRLLFHIRVHVALEQRIAEGKLDAAIARDRIERIGRAAFEEAKLVLRQEDILLPPIDELATYVEFVAVYWELRFFANTLLPRYFPTLPPSGDVDRILSEDLDAAALLTETRLPGAPLPVPPTEEMEDDAAEEIEDEELDVLPAKASERLYRRLNRRAERAATLGNAVRAAILRTRAARHVRPSLAARATAAARVDLNRLTDRLQAALGFSDRDRRRWSRVLLALLGRSASGFWTRESRTLYDLQKVCIDFERDVYKLDLIEWIISRGRLPIKRHLPGQREVLMSKHLRVALRRSAKVRLPERDRRRLASLLAGEVERAEHKLRDRFRPLIDGALESVGLRPKNLPEKVARQKLVEELLDRVVADGFLGMSDLRDAISRNQLKLPDLSGGEEFFSGDQLLRADRQLAATLDGVYHRGEVYLRLPQRLSSLAFGAPPGRLLVRYVALPYGGAYVILEGVKHLLEKIVSGPAAASAPIEAGGAVGPASHPVNIMPGDTLLLAVLVVGTFLLGLMHAEKFRKICLETLRGVYRVLRWTVVEVPAWLMRLPWVQRLLKSKYYRWTARYIGKPLVFTALTMAAFPPLAQTRFALLWNSAWIFVLSNLLVNSRVGRNAEEVITDWAVRGWEHFRIRILKTLVQSVMEFFNRVVDTLDRFLYSVDEWLRFRSGQGRLAVVAKSVLGVIWFFVTYVVRFAINLLIEPQINPVKHFPVVTVSHKILLSLAPVTHPIVVGALERFVGEAAAKTIFWNGIFVLPGVIGFLVWELKENWRLYQANRPKALGPVPVGAHGETMVRLLRPGFHSGTLPKLYARLRRADRRAYWTGNWKTSRKYRDAIRRVEREIRNLIERELLALLSQSRRFGGRELSLGRLKTGAGSVRFELCCPERPEAPLWMALEERSGWLAARVIEPGWSESLDDAAGQALADALTGLYKIAGVELIREQIESALEQDSRYEVNESGLIVWTDHQAAPRFYDLRKLYEAQSPQASSTPNDPAQLDLERMAFFASPVTWELWVEVWDRDQSGGRYPPRLVIGAHLLPAPVPHPAVQAT